MTEEMKFSPIEKILAVASYVSAMGGNIDLQFKAHDLIQKSQSLGQKIPSFGEILNEGNWGYAAGAVLSVAIIGLYRAGRRYERNALH